MEDLWQFANPAGTAIVTSSTQVATLTQVIELKENTLIVEDKEPEWYKYTSEAAGSTGGGGTAAPTFGAPRATHWPSPPQSLPTTDPLSSPTPQAPTRTDGPTVGRAPPLWLWTSFLALVSSEGRARRAFSATRALQLPHIPRPLTPSYNAEKCLWRRWVLTCGLTTNTWLWLAVFGGVLFLMLCAVGTHYYRRYKRQRAALTRVTNLLRNLGRSGALNRNGIGADAIAPLANW